MVTMQSYHGAKSGEDEGAGDGQPVIETREERATESIAPVNQPLIDWIQTLWGPGTKFRSARQLAIACGLSQGTLNWIQQRGVTSPDSLTKLARVARRSVIEAYIAAGWLTDQEIREYLLTDYDDPQRPVNRLLELGWLKIDDLASYFRNTEEGLSPDESQAIREIRELPEHMRDTLYSMIHAAYTSQTGRN